MAGTRGMPEIRYAPAAPGVPVVSYFLESKSGLSGFQDLLESRILLVIVEGHVATELIRRVARPDRPPGPGVDLFPPARHGADLGASEKRAVWPGLSCNASCTLLRASS